MKHLNSDLKPLAKGLFLDRGPDLFGKSFGDQAKATADSIKALKGVQSQKHFPGAAVQSTIPRVTASIGAFLSQILRSQY